MPLFDGPANSSFDVWLSEQHPLWPKGHMEVKGWTRSFRWSSGNKTIMSCLNLEMVLVYPWQELNMSTAQFWGLRFVLPATKLEWVDGWGIGMKSWHNKSFPKYHLPSYSPRSAYKALNKTHLHICETGFTFLLLNDLVFVFHRVPLWTCIIPFPSFGWTLTRLRIEKQCGVIIGQSVENLGEGCLICLQINFSIALFQDIFGVKDSMKIFHLLKTLIQ